MRLLLANADKYDLPCDQKGWLYTPRSWDSLSTIAKSELPLCCDNDCFGNWDRDRFVRMLCNVSTLQCLQWVACPDVVADSEATLNRFRQWQPLFEKLNVPAALVAQNGLQSKQLPWDDITCLFIGGDTEWKLGPEAAALVFEAKDRGKWVHMGRVNSIKRMEYAKTLGCDSVDGSSWARWRDKYNPLAVRGLSTPKQYALRDVIAGSAQ